MMTTPNTGVGDGQWHIELDGKRSSPMPASAVRNLIDAGKLTDKSLAWRPGMPTWLPLAETEFASVFHQTPPPLVQRVPQGLIWTLAFAPLVGVFLEGVVAGFTRSAMGGYWWITLALNIGLSIVDERRVNAAGYKTGGAGAALLVPVYMWKRAAALGQQPWYLGVWIVCFLSSMLT